MELCHCGNPVLGESDPEMMYQPLSIATQALYLNFCDLCCLVRCDAYPGACKND